MSAEDNNKSEDADVDGALAALRRAAEAARDLAIQTDTGIIIVQDGKMVRVTAEELRRQRAEAKSSPTQ